MLDVCYRPLQIELFEMSDNNLIAVLCDHGGIEVAFLDEKANFLLSW